MSTENLSFSLPDGQIAWIEEQVRSGAYGDRSAYVRDLIHRDQRRRQLEALQSDLLEAKASIEAGEGEVVDEDWFRKLRADLRRSVDGQSVNGA